MVVEIGGVGFDPEIEARWRETTRRGLRNVLRGLGMVAGEPELPPQLLVFQRVKRVNPRHGGMIEPLISADEMMVREVQAGELLGRVWSPYTFETLEELRAPFRGLLDMAPHARPARPGDWAYLVVDLDDPRTKWIDARAGQP
jgi:predicted deacylase